MLRVPMMLRNTDIEGDTVSRQEEQRPKAEDIHSEMVGDKELSFICSHVFNNK